MYYQEDGDIIFQKEGHWRDNISRCVMSSKTIWHYLLGNKENVPYYHANIAYGNCVIFEQKRWEARIVNWNNDKKQIIFRPLNHNIGSIVADQKYDFLNCFGHLMAMRYCRDNCGENFQ